VLWSDGIGGGQSICPEVRFLNPEKVRLGHSAPLIFDGLQETDFIRASEAEAVDVAPSDQGKWQREVPEPRTGDWNEEDTLKSSISAQQSNLGQPWRPSIPRLQYHVGSLHIRRVRQGIGRARG
jgi:hypothetical protein